MDPIEFKANILTAIANATGNEVRKPYLNDVRLQQLDGTTRLVASNGKILAVVKIAEGTPGFLDVPITKAQINALGSKGSLTISFEDKTVMISNGPTTFELKHVYPDQTKWYPDWRPNVPKVLTRKVSQTTMVDVYQLQQAVKVLEPFIELRKESRGMAYRLWHGATPGEPTVLAISQELANHGDAFVVIMPLRFDDDRWERPIWLK